MFEAHLADEVAKTNGSRVILCATHEPPTAIWSNSTLLEAAAGWGGQNESSPAWSFEDAMNAPGARDLDVDFHAAAATMFSGNITRGEMCAFLTGHFEFLPEARVTVDSVVHFMPGMRVGIATHSNDFQVFNR